MRLLKLLRIMRVGRIIDRWQAALGATYQSVALVQFSMTVVIVAHWMACVWGYIGVQVDEV